MNTNVMSYQAMNDQCCCFNLRKISRAVTQFFDRHLELAGIRATQFTLLLSLSSISGKTLTEMAESLVMDRTTLTRNLKPLERMGLITGVKLSDRRSKAYALTEKGKEVILRGVPLWQKAQQQIVGRLGHDRYDRFLEELTFVRKLAVPKGEDK